MKYAINKGIGKASFFDGSVLIPVGGYVSLTDKQAEHEEIIAAETRGWIKLTRIEPNLDPKGDKPAEIVFENNKPAGSLFPPGKEPKVEVVEEPKVIEVSVTETVAVVEEAIPKKKAKKE